MKYNRSISFFETYFCFEQETAWCYGSQHGISFGVFSHTVLTRECPQMSVKSKGNLTRSLEAVYAGLVRNGIPPQVAKTALRGHSDDLWDAYLHRATLVVASGLEVTIEHDRRTGALYLDFEKIVNKKHKSCPGTDDDKMEAAQRFCQHQYK